MTIIAITEAILAIVSSGYACHGLCCGDSNKQVKSTQGNPLEIMVDVNLYSWSKGIERPRLYSSHV